MAKELIINASLPEVRIALMEDGQIQELLIERDSEKGITGNIYKGRVTRVLPGMQAAFVDVGLEKAAFLYVDDIYVHPKVMGEETEIHEMDEGQDEGNSNDDSEEYETSGDQGDEAHDAHDAQMGSESLESHVAEHVEAEMTASVDEVEQEIHDAAMDGDEDEEGDSDESDDSEESEQGSDQANETSEQQSEMAMSSENADVNAEGSTSEGNAEGSSELSGLAQPGKGGRKFRGRQRNRRRGRGGKDGKDTKTTGQFAAGESFEDPNLIPSSMTENLQDKGDVESDRAQMEGEARNTTGNTGKARNRAEFRQPRNRDRRIKSRHSKPRAQANIADLLKEGQEVIVQVAKDPIATKGARLTCHVSLPGRHLVCMPTIDHVGVSRRIERDDERRTLRDYVEKNRPRKMGFIVRTASGGKNPEAWIKQDIDYLSKLWTKIRNKADDVSAPSLVYEDLNSVLRSIRDWVNEDIDKIIVDSRYHYNELMEFADRFMPALIDKIELYLGDIPIFDAYGISSELHRSLERRVWLKSGGYIVIDQAEALVAIDVNTGRFVGKTNLEATILKTNLEAAEEIAYQLRLRNCGGIIIVDLIDMEREENKMRVYRAMDEALKKDRARPTIQKISDLGLIEMTRKRTRDTIIRTLCEPCVHCEGKGFSKSTRTVAYEILREVERLGVDRDARKILISAHESVIDILAIDLREAMDSLEKRYNKTVYLQGVMDFHSEQFEVVTDRTPGKKQSQDIARQLRIERERAERKEKQKSRSREDREERGPREDRNSRDERDDELSAMDAAPPSSSEPVVPAPPAKKAEGAFVVKAAVIAPATKIVAKEPVEGEVQEEAAPAEADLDTEQTEFMGNAEPVMVSRGNTSGGGSHGGIEDEDQLAYLRAQAAQDAALAYEGSSPSVPGSDRGGQSRGGHRNNQNPRNNNQRGGGRGGQQQRDSRGGGRGRPQQQRFPSRNQNRPQPERASGPAPVAAQSAAPGPQHVYEAQVPDYEVLIKPTSGDGNG